jgi:hypothetical protein
MLIMVAGAKHIFTGYQTVNCSRALLERPPMSLGDFNVFMGDLSLHRVTPMTDARKRIVALFSYDRNAGTTFDQWYIRQLSQGLPN